MSKILLLSILFLSLNTTFSSEVRATDGSCAKLLASADALSTENRSTADQLSSYLKELFDQDVISEQELVSFRDALLRGERINPLQDPELDIARYVAAEKIAELVKQNLDMQPTLLAVTQILDKNQSDSIEVQQTTSNITGKLFKLMTAEQGEFEEFRDFIITHFSKPESVKNHEVLRRAIEITPPHRLDIYGEQIFPHAYWVVHPELLRLVIEKSYTYWFNATVVFSQPHWVAHPELLRLVLKQTRSVYLLDYTQNVFSKPLWSNHPELLRLAIERSPKNDMHEYASFVFSKEHWSNHPELLRLAIEKTPAVKMSYFAKHVFSKEHWSNHPELLRLAIEKTPMEYRWVYIDYVFSKSHHSNQSVLKASLDINSPTDRTLFLREQLGRYSWEGTEQENLEEYLDKLYGRIDE